MDPIAYMIMMFAGGVALFLLGMKLMTDGLKVAAGSTLRNLLAKWTSTVTKGVLTGVLITALVQSSSAVIFATIGFVNAGIMSLLQAVYVIFGSNVGTTLTGWIVASVGFKVNLQLLSMPLLAVGMILWMSGKTSRTGALGQALVGFSIFFLGIDVLKNTFDDMGEFIPFDQIGTGFWAGMLLFLIGILLTSVMQSSSAAIAVIITAVGGGMIPVYAGAIMVVGADIGTTSTALLAVIGATANAKRAAMAHVLFNVLKGPLALPFVGFYIGLIYSVFGSDIDLPYVIAIFHTLIKLIGLIVLLPFTGMLVRFLEKRFTKDDIIQEKPRYLDDTLVNTPSLAAGALIFELKRVGRKSRRLVRDSLAGEVKSLDIRKQAARITSLESAVNDYILKLQGSGFPHDKEFLMPHSIRVLQYFNEARSSTLELLNVPKVRIYKDLEKDLNDLKYKLQVFLEKADSETAGFSIKKLRKRRIELDKAYQKMKSALLKETAKGYLTMEDMVQVQEQIRSMRRIWDQLYKAAEYLDEFNLLLEHEPGTGPKLHEPELETMEAPES